MVPVRTIEPNYKRTPLSSSSSWKQQALEVSRRYIITSGWVSQRIDEGFRSGLCRDMMRDCRDVQNECNKGVLSGISWKALSNKVLPHLSSSTCYQCRKGDEWALALILWWCVVLRYSCNLLGNDILDLGKAGMVVFGSRRQYTTWTSISLSPVVRWL